MSADGGAERRDGPERAVAVVGVGCRLPGGITDLDGLWRALSRGDDRVGTVPPDRFDVDRHVDESAPRPDRSYTRAGGFLDDIASFDAAYFGISPKEAATMDPQQRLLLEMAAEAFDDAGIDPATLAGSDTGVFVGISDCGRRPRSCRWCPTVTGEVLPGEEAGAGYWWRNVRRPVRFAAAVRRLLADGFDVLVEVGPHPVLASYLRRGCAASRVRAAVVPTLRRAAPGPAAVRSAVARVVAAGGEVDWARHFPRPGRVRTLPAYPWRRQRHWVGDPASWVRPVADPRIRHPLLGQRLPTLDPAWYGELDRARVPWLADHEAAGSAVLPATGYLEMALAAGRAALPEAAEAVEVDQVAISRVLTVPTEPDAEPVYAQTTLSAATGVVTVAGTGPRGRHPREHFRARVRPLLRRRPAPLDVAALRARVATPVDPAGHYARAAEGRMVWGPSFRVLTGLWAGDGEVLGAYSARTSGTSATRRIRWCWTARCRPGCCGWWTSCGRASATCRRRSARSGCGGGPPPKGWCTCGGGPAPPRRCAGTSRSPTPTGGSAPSWRPSGCAASRYCTPPRSPATTSSCARPLAPGSPARPGRPRRRRSSSRARSTGSRRCPRPGASWGTTRTRTGWRRPSPGSSPPRSPS